MPFFGLLALLVLVAAPARAAGDNCRDVSHGGATYLVCSFDPSVADIRMYNKDMDGKPYGSFAALTSDLWRYGRFTVFAMNGGMYHSDLSPVGLFVENGEERQPVSTSSGWGNFHLLPNGIFFLDQGRAGVLETQAYLRTYGNQRSQPDYATQSGPMLLVDGRLHPRFLADSDSFKRRNGVGVDGNGMVHFVISNSPVRFHDFATLFRDELDCENALYLDGTISSVEIPSLQRRDSLFPVGPIIAVVESVPG